MGGKGARIGEDWGGWGGGGGGEVSVVMDWENLNESV